MFGYLSNSREVKSRLCTNLHPAFSCWKVSVCFPFKSFNTEGCIKGVTNQADRERCHRVSILLGCWTSLRKTTPSILTSDDPARTHSTCICIRQVYIWTQALGSAITLMPLHIFQRSVANQAIHILLGINMKDDSVKRWACVEESWLKRQNMETHLDVFGSVSHPRSLLGQAYF